MTQGYFVIALGKQYIDEAKALLETIRKQDDTRPMSLLVNEKDLDYAKQQDMFDQFIIFSPKDELYNDMKVSHEKYCTYPKMMLDQYIPYNETCFIDSDVLCQYKTGKLWNYLTHQHQSVVLIGHKEDKKWHFGQIENVIKKFGKPVPHTHTGFIYLRKNDKLKEFFNKLRELFLGYDKYGCKRQFRGGRTIEVVYALAYAHFDRNPLEYDDVPIMTFNYKAGETLPSKKQTGGKFIHSFVEMNDPIPFIHMFGKMKSQDYKDLYNKIMKV